MTIATSIESRLWPKVDRRGPDECWPWTAADNGAGYGVIGHEGRIVYAHRFAYGSLVGPIPAGTELDHLCRNRGCVNPAHLEPVTHRENVARGQAPAARIARTGSCASGHPRTPENTWRRGGKTFCRPCHARWAREARIRRAAERMTDRGN